MEKVILMGLELPETEDFQTSMEELKELARACELLVEGVYTQRAASVNKAYYIGTGKVSELKDEIGRVKAELVIFNNALSPMQLRNLNQALEVPVMDRTTLILEIFSKRARTREAKLSVEVASLNYALPRLVGLHDALSRQGGTSGAMSSRGAGEKKLELDRRHIEARLAALRRELAHVKAERETRRSKRQKSSTPLVSLVGYTNAGKSSIMNGFMSMYGAPEEKKVYEEDMLFATLDTTIRRIDDNEGKSYLLSDTVGFISELPHHLVDAFRSTLEEARDADLLLVVADYSDEHYREHIKVTRETLNELGAGDIPVLYVYNKCDRVSSGGKTAPYPYEAEGEVYICAKEESSLHFLDEVIKKHLFGDRQVCELLVPFDKGSVLNVLKNEAEVLKTDYIPEGIAITAVLSEELMGRYREYLVNVEKSK